MKRSTSFTHYCSSHTFVDPEQREHYLPVFTELYWWNTPRIEVGDEVRPQLVGLSGIWRHFRKGNLDHNDGLWRLNGLSFPDAIVDPLLYADSLPVNTALKLDIETCVFEHGNPDSVGEGVLSAGEIDGGYSAAFFSNTKRCLYTRSAEWVIAHGVSGPIEQPSRSAFLGLTIDPEHSYGAGLSNDPCPVLSVKDITVRGTDVLKVGSTSVEKDKRTTIYTRVREARQFTIDAGRRGASYIDTDSLSHN